MLRGKRYFYDPLPGGEGMRSLLMMEAENILTVLETFLEIVMTERICGISEHSSNSLNVIANSSQIIYETLREEIGTLNIFIFSI